MRIFKTSLAFFSALLAGCSVVSTPISGNVEARLLKTRMTDTEFGAQVTADGKHLNFPMYEGELTPEPVSLPMRRSFRKLPGLDAVLNGRSRVRMLADTGAQLSIVDAGSVLAAGGRVYVPESWDFSVTGIGGKEKAWLARFDTARFGPMVLRKFATAVRREKSEMRVGGLVTSRVPINLLGSPVLLGFSYVTFDYPGQRFVFSAGAPYAPAPGARRVPLTVRDQLIFVPLRIGTRTVEAMVDTGARDQVFLNTTTVRRLGLTALAEKGGAYRAVGIGGETRGRQFPLALTFLGNVPLRDVIVDTAESDSWDARIGTELLERWRVTFDFKNGALWLE